MEDKCKSMITRASLIVILILYVIASSTIIVPITYWVVTGRSWLKIFDSIVKEMDKAISNE